MVTKIIVSKLDAARRQIETAIRLYFNDADPISIHTLTCASYTILSDLNKKKGGLHMILDGVGVKKEKKKEFRKMVYEAKNHFKHADRDPDTVIKFYPRTNEHILFDCCSKYSELTSEKPSYFRIYQGWYVSKHIDIFEYSKEEMINILKIQESYGDNRLEYFRAMLSVSGDLK